MITLYTAATPNGHKISIALEELGLSYEVRSLDLGAGEQKDPAYVALNPNARIPTIVDHEGPGGGDFAVFESGAILIYLAEKTGKLLPADPRGRSVAIQWLMFQMGGVGPMMGQAGVFVRYAPEKIPFAIQRYQRESRRLFEVLDRRLQASEWLGPEYSIADIATFPWVRSHTWSEIPFDGLPHVERWLAAMEERPAVKRGLAVPDTKIRSEERIEAARKILV